MLSLFNRVVPYLSALLIAIALELWSVYPLAVYYVSGSILLIVMLSLWSVTGGGVPRRLYWSFLVTPFFSMLSTILFIMFIDQSIVRQIVIGIMSIVFLLIVRNVRSYVDQAEHYQPYALENLYSYVNLVSLYFFFACGYGMMLLLGVVFWPVAVSLSVLTTFLFMWTLWSLKIKWSEVKLYIMTVGLVILGAAYLISFLPTSFIFDALLLSAMYYILMNFIKDHVKGTLDEKHARRYIAISIVVVAIAVLTTKWY